MRRDKPPTDGRDARGEGTRQRLLDTGVAVFGARGFDAVSTRELALQAGVNQAAILYHFGGKEQLYVAVAERIAARGREALGRLAESEPGEGRRLPGTPEAAAARLSATLEAMLRALLDFADDGAAVAFVMREQAQAGPGFGALYDGYIRPLHERVTRLVARATRRSAKSTDTIVDAHALIGLALSFAVASATLLRRTGWTEYDRAHVDRIASRVAALAYHAVFGLAAAKAPRASAHERVSE